MQTLKILHDFIIIISISLTVPFVCMSFEISRLWKPCLTKDPIPSKVLSKGIVYGFSSNLVDTIYWTCAWLIVLIDKDYAMIALFWGTISHVFFRQTGGIIAALHYVHAADMVEKRGLTKRHKWYWLMGGIIFLALVSFRFNGVSL